MMRTIAAVFLVVNLFVGGVSFGGDKKTAASVDATRVRRAVEKGLVFVEHHSMRWWSQDRCITCHDGGMLLVAANVAKRRGVPVDRDRLRLWTEKWWYAGAFHPVLGKKKHSVGGMPTLPLMLLFRDREIDESPLTAKALTNVFRHTAAEQIPGKKWKPEKPAAHIPWIVMSLASLESSKIHFTPYVRSEITAARQQSEKWIRDHKPSPPAETDALAAWTVYEHKRGERTRAVLMRKELLKRQNPDGGWGLKKGADSHAYATGHALFALKQIGLPNRHPAVRQTLRHLLELQKKDGRWIAKGRVFKIGENFGEADTWATGIITAALSLTLPQLPPGTRPVFTPDAKLRREIDALTKEASETYVGDYLEPPPARARKPRLAK